MSLVSSSEASVLLTHHPTVRNITKENLLSPAPDLRPVSYQLPIYWTHQYLRLATLCTSPVRLVYSRGNYGIVINLHDTISLFLSSGEYRLEINEPIKKPKQLFGTLDYSWVDKGVWVRTESPGAIKQMKMCWWGFFWLLMQRCPLDIDRKVRFSTVDYLINPTCSNYLMITLRLWNTYLTHKKT